MSKGPTRYVLALLLLSPVILSQSQEVPAKPAEPASSQPTPVRITISISGKHGNAVKSISKDDLTLFDDKQPASISELRPASDEPITYALLLDLSASERDIAPSVRDAALRIFDALDSEHAKGFLVLASAKVRLSRSYATRNDLSRTLDEASYGGGTALYDAVDIACREQLGSEQVASGRRVLLILSDGNDNQSHVTARQATEAALRSRVTILAVELASPQWSNASGKLVLNDFAEHTGGRLISSAEDLLQALRNQFVIAFTAGNMLPQGHLHSLKIKSDRKGLRISAPEGFYSPSAVRFDSGVPKAEVGSNANADSQPQPLPQRVRISQGVSDGNRVHAVAPIYPEDARVGRIQGAVVLRVVIGRDGVVQKVEVTSGHPMLAPAAVDAVRKRRYRPYLLNGEPVEVETQVTIHFVLNG